MRDAVNDYLSHQSALGRSVRTLDAYKQRLGYFRAHCKVRLCDITSKHIRSYHDTLLRLSVNTRIHYLSTLQAFLSWAYENGRMLSEIHIEIPAKEKTLPPTALSLDQVRELLALPASIRDRAILETFYGCGLRMEELLRLNTGDIDDNVVHIRGKGDKGRLVPINRHALETIGRYLSTRSVNKRSPLFVTASGKRLDGNNIASLFRKINKNFPVHVHPHLLRHTFAVHLLKGGADIRYVQALLGHESPDTTSRYLGLAKEELKAEYDRAMEQVLGGE